MARKQFESFFFQNQMKIFYSSTNILLSIGWNALFAKLFEKNDLIENLIQIL